MTLATLLLGIVQVPAVLVTLPVIVYVLATEATQPAIIFPVWTLVAGLSDNVLKPLLLGRGLEVPMPVILIGVIGGMIADGLLGLFVGPVVLAVGYVLLMEWMRHDPVEARPQTDVRRRDRGSCVRLAGDVGMPLHFRCWHRYRPRPFSGIFLQFSILMIGLMIGNIVRVAF